MTVVHLPTNPVPADRKGRRIAFMNNKGGVGKTDVTRNLGAALAARGNRVLFVDMDPQGNLTRRLGITVDDDTLTIGEVLHGRVKGSAQEAIYACGWDIPEAENIHVIPADLSLTDRDNEAAQAGSDNRLARVLYGVTDEYDYTIIDCRPTLGHLEQMVVRALEDEQDGYYLVVNPGTDEIGGAFRVTEQVAIWADDMDVAAAPLGVIVNRYAAGYSLHKGRTSTLEQSITLPASTPDRPGPPIMEPYIPQAIRFGEIDDLALPTLHDKRLTREGITAKLDDLAAQIDRAA